MVALVNYCDHLIFFYLLGLFLCLFNITAILHVSLISVLLLKMCDFRDMFLSQFNVLVISNSSFFLSRIYRCGEQKSEGY